MEAIKITAISITGIESTDSTVYLNLDSIQFIRVVETVVDDETTITGEIHLNNVSVIIVVDSDTLNNITNKILWK